MEHFKYMLQVARYYAFEYDPVLEHVDGCQATPIPIHIVEKAFKDGKTPQECAGDLAQLVKKMKEKHY